MAEPRIAFGTSRSSADIVVSRVGGEPEQTGTVSVHEPDVQVKAGTAATAGKRDSASVRRPRWTTIASRVVAEIDLVGSIGVHEENLGIITAPAGPEGDPWFGHDCTLLDAEPDD